MIVPTIPTCRRGRIMESRLSKRLVNTLKRKGLLIYLLFTVIVLYFVLFGCKCDGGCGGDSDSGNLGADKVSVPIHQIMSGKPVELAQTDKQLLKYIWDNGLLERPSTLNYNLTNPTTILYGRQEQLVQKILGNVTNGFFLEVGGYDGETKSKSLWLEMYLGWEGLLVEPDPHNYAVLKMKNRKAWTSHSCLSMHPYPHQTDFLLQKIHPSMEKFMDPKDGITKNVVKVQCIPLFSFLSALNVTQVDYFSLDVEGRELDILKTVPFDIVIFKILSVEFLVTEDKKGREVLLQFMNSKGYKLVKVIPRKYGMANDFIFVHYTV